MKMRLWWFWVLAPVQKWFLVMGLGFLVVVVALVGTINIHPFNFIPSGLGITLALVGIGIALYGFIRVFKGVIDVVSSLTSVNIYDFHAGMYRKRVHALWLLVGVPDFRFS